MRLRTGSGTSAVQNQCDCFMCLLPRGRDPALLGATDIAEARVAQDWRASKQNC